MSSHAHVITATEASRMFSHILNQVFYQGEQFDIERGKTIVATISSPMVRRKSFKVADLNNFFKNLPKLEAGDGEAFIDDIKAIRAEHNYEEKTWD